jgi:hypothetical protein
VIALCRVGRRPTATAYLENGNGLDMPRQANAFLFSLVQYHLAEFVGPELSKPHVAIRPLDDAVHNR